MFARRHVVAYGGKDGAAAEHVDGSLMAGRATRGRGRATDTAKVREELLATAESCFERYGISRTSMDDIAEAAQVSRPTLYRYFGDRESLITEIVQSRSRRLVKHFHAFVDGHESYEDKLVQGLLYLVGHGRKDQFVSVLLGPENFALATGILMNEGGHAIEFAGWCWQPVLEAGVADGSLRPDLDVDFAIHWLASFSFTLISWLDVENEPRDWHARMLREFAVAGLFHSPVDRR